MSQAMNYMNKEKQAKVAVQDVRLMFANFNIVITADDAREMYEVQ